MSLPAWGAWIEMALFLCSDSNRLTSLPAWGAWIEILFITCIIFLLPVAPRMGGVD